MFRKIAIFITMFFLCLGLYNCKSPVAPEEPEPEPNYEYRYNVKVIYTPVTEPKNQFWLMLYCYLYDPALMGEYDTEHIQMEKIGKNKYRCYITKVFIQTMAHSKKHRVQIWFDKSDDTKFPTVENIDVQGAYAQEFEISDWSNFYKFFLYFKMSKE